MLTTKQIARVESKKRKVRAFLQLANDMDGPLRSSVDEVSFVERWWYVCIGNLKSRAVGSY